MPTITLTDRKIAGLKPTGKQRDYFDRSLPGFGVRVNQHGRKSFILMYRTAEKKLRRQTLGAYGLEPPGMNLAKARDEARKELQKATIGRDPAAERKQAKINTIDALCTEYIERHAKKRKRTWRDDQSKITCEILPVWKGRPVVSITRRACLDLIEAIADRGAPIYANRIAALLSRLFRFAVEREIITANPAAHLPKPGVEAQARPEGEQEPKPYDADEMRTIWQHTETLDPKPRAIYRLGLVTGQRPAEVSDLEWPEIDGAWWTIPGRRTKNGREHRVFLAPLALDVLKGVPRVADEPSDETTAEPPDETTAEPPKPQHVFAGYRGKRQLAAINTQVFAGVRRRKKPRHALRDTVATGLAACGIAIEDIAKVLNHAHGPRVTHGYNAYAYDKEKKIALGKWSRKLTAILEQKDEAKVVPFTKGA